MTLFIFYTYDCHIYMQPYRDSYVPFSHQICKLHEKVWVFTVLRIQDDGLHSE